MGDIDRNGATIYQFRVASISQSSSATEELGSTPIDAAEMAAGETKEQPRGFLQAARRGLSEEELSTPAARRFLIADLERLDRLCVEQPALCRAQELKRGSDEKSSGPFYIMGWDSLLSPGSNRDVERWGKA
jgi:hypothetical protein